MGDQFPTTLWHLVLRAQSGPTKQAQEALATLCQVYWYPLYAFVRRQNYGPEEAQDLTQAFFAQLLEKHYLDDYERERGRFRSFLLTALKHFLSNERDRSRALKRGGGITLAPLDALIQTGETRYTREPQYSSTPESIYEKQWALTLLDHVLIRLRAEFAKTGKEDQFDRVKDLLTGDENHIAYSDLAAELQTTEGALKVAIHRMRRRFREVLRDEISRTVSQPDLVGEEIRYLMAVIAAR
jgi:RNA polymerase sigma-70 factor (ECF subfamily)